MKTKATPAWSFGKDKWYVSNFCILPVQLLQIFFNLIILSFFLSVGPTYVMVDFKKKLLELYKNCTEVVNVSYFYGETCQLLDGIEFSQF
jgi:hypothetical protein